MRSGEFKEWPPAGAGGHSCLLRPVGGERRAAKMGRLPHAPDGRLTPVSECEGPLPRPLSNPVCAQEHDAVERQADVVVPQRADGITGPAAVPALSA
jgi:hypothetical protein